MPYRDAPAGVQHLQLTNTMTKRLRSPLAKRSCSDAWNCSAVGGLILMSTGWSDSGGRPSPAATSSSMAVHRLASRLLMAANSCFCLALVADSRPCQKSLTSASICRAGGAGD